MIVIIDYDMGNVGSIRNMLKKVGVESIISSDIASIREADKLILPGVGAFDNGMRKLQERGLIPVLNEKVLVKKTPVMGLCIGMHLITECSEEGQLPGLGWIEGKTVRFKFNSDRSNLKIPHMGWNALKLEHPSPLFPNGADEQRFYFAHSYHVVCRFADHVIATTEYGCQFPSVIRRDNITGTQFHPEKSHRFGMNLLKNFVESY